MSGAAARTGELRKYRRNRNTRKNNGRVIVKNYNANNKTVNRTI